MSVSDIIGFVPVVWDRVVLHDGCTTLVPCETASGEPAVLLLHGDEAEKDALLLLLLKAGDVPPQRHGSCSQPRPGHATRAHGAPTRSPDGPGGCSSAAERVP